MHSLENLIAYYNNCKQDDLYREVIRHILHNLKKIGEASIYDLADLCYVSPTTISRLSKKLGYRSFIDFKTDLSKSVDNYDTLNRYVPMNQMGLYTSVSDAYLEVLQFRINDMVRSIDPNYLNLLADYIHKFKKINFYTNGICFSEPHFQQDLIMSGHESSVFSIPIDQLQDIDMLEEDSLVIIAVPVVAESSVSLKIINLIKERKAHIILLTNTKFSKLISYADYSYCFEGSMSIIDDYIFSMFINLLSITYRSKYII